MVKLFAKEKKESTRKESELSRLFEFSLVLPNKQQVQGYLVDLNMDGAAITFPAGECPDFQADERVRLSLTIRQTEKKILMDAHVRGLRKDKTGSLCQFKFIDTSSVIHKLDQILLSYFNRREAFRVSTDLNRPIEVDIEWDDKSAKGWLIDVSINGMCLGIEGDINVVFKPSDQLILSFCLPEHELPLTIVGKVVRRTPTGKHARYGVNFDWKQTEDFRKQERAIHQYTMQRQMSALKMRSNDE